MIADTSLKAYRERVAPKIQEREAPVLTILRIKGPMTNSEITEALGWRVNQVTGRTNNLVKKGLVRMARKRICKVTGELAKEWEATMTSTEGIPRVYLQGREKIINQMTIF